MKLEYQNRRGIPEADIAPPQYERVRLTIPAREALQAARAKIAPEPSDGGPQTYTVELSLDHAVPKGLVAVRIAYTSHVGLRLETEPEYPGEVSTHWEQLDFTGCPECGKPLIWYEAGYVSGYRVCGGRAHHHVLALRNDSQALHGGDRQ